MHVNGETYLLILSSCLLLVKGASIESSETENDAVEDECSHPPINTEMVSCCAMPKQHLLGSIKETLRFCAEKMKANKDGEEEKEVDGLSTPSPSPSPPTEEQGRRRHHFRRFFQDGCFMECVFERENFLLENKVNKEALMERTQASLRDDEDWRDIVRDGVDKCLSNDLEIMANETCRSGSAETLSCIFKHMFLECPLWLADNEYCSSLREFYHKCPNGPPPEVFGKHRRYRYRTRSTDDEVEESENNDAPEEMAD